MNDLTNQHEYRGAVLAPTNIYVCREDLDRPFPFARPVILPPDPEPHLPARPENFNEEMNQTTPNPLPPPKGTTSQAAAGVL